MIHQNINSDTPSPLATTKRYIFLDALRGIALLGICLANYPEFALYTFLSETTTQAMKSAGIDGICKFLMYFFIDGKFYTIFSLLFGIGFSIILANAYQKGASGLRIFYRRMVVLFLIGFCHLMLVWSGDILVLYALMGMLLPLFRKVSNRALIIWASVFLCLPILVDFICEWCALNPSESLVSLQWSLCDRYGITAENFAYWLRDARSYKEVHEFLMQGAIERMQEFVDGNRYFKVLGLFILGYYIGRNEYYKKFDEIMPVLRSFFRAGFFAGLPLSLVYAYSCVKHHPFGLGLHSVLYLVSVYTLSFGYVASLGLLYNRYQKAKIWKIFSFPGRMALTCYIGQSLMGMFIFYGVGLALGATYGLGMAELLALCVFSFEVMFCACWLQYFRFGPLEWFWRCLTYKKFMRITLSKDCDC